MTTNEKTAAIQSILANQQDNVAAVRAAKLNPALDTQVVTAMNNALIADLEKVFFLPESGVSFQQEASAVKRSARKADR